MFKKNFSNLQLLIFIIVILIIKPGNCYSQNKIAKSPALGVHFFAIDFKTPADIKSNGLGNLFKPQWSSMRQGLSLSYLRGLSNNVDISVNLSGSFLDYPFKNRSLTGNNNLLLQTSITANIKLKTDKSWFTPFLSAGTSVSKYKNYYGLLTPAGMGVQFNYRQEVFVLMQTSYFFSITNNVSDHIIHSIGIAGNLKKRKLQTVKAIPMAIPSNVTNQDKDNDGVVDIEDRCPDVPGPIVFKGCPDLDNDSIPDIDDKCPTVSGLLKYNGCPVPDTDNDGINDEEDRCPLVYGVERYKGCPVPDSDNDGVNDERDKCVADSGSIENNGCPVVDTVITKEINNAAKLIFFKTGSAVLLPLSYQPLDVVAKLLEGNLKYKLLIEGHTDNTGSDSANLILSKKRAGSVKQYLVAKGIDSSRIDIDGFGAGKPIADNRTVSGKAANRRVELIISY